MATDLPLGLAAARPDSVALVLDLLAGFKFCFTDALGFSVRDDAPAPLLEDVSRPEPVDGRPLDDARVDFGVDVPGLRTDGAGSFIG
ncbi:MAG: hypothetical protein AB7G13_34915 [Lautropia sp.]